MDNDTIKKITSLCEKREMLEEIKKKLCNDYLHLILGFSRNRKCYDIDYSLSRVLIDYLDKYKKMIIEETEKKIDVINNKLREL